MAGTKKSKVRRVVKKGQEGNKRSIQSMIDNATEPLSSNSCNLTVNGSLQARSNVSSWISTPSSSNALSLSNMNPVSFSQNAKPMAPSPQKRKPIVSLGQSNTLRSSTCEASEKMRSDRRRQISNRARPPKAVVPGLVQDLRCRDPDFLIKDQRHMNGGLVHLPKEPDVKRTPNFIRKGYFRFLDLPAEVRNQVYNYLIQPQCYALQWDSEGRRGKLLTHRLPKRLNACQPRMSQSTRQRRGDLRKRPRCAEREHLMNDLYSNCSPVALSWVCKKMYGEASSMFYSKSTFIFEGIGPLRHFMNNATPQTKASITKLKLTHKAYGHPAKTDNRIWKTKADRKWEDLCWRISYELTSITHLILDLDYGYSKLQFVPLFDTDSHVFGTEWRIPLWAFEDLDLKSFACRLRSATTSEAVLEVESYKIRQALLGTAWDDEVEKGRDGFGSKMRQKEGKPRKAVGSIQINHKGEVFGLS